MCIRDRDIPDDPYVLKIRVIKGDHDSDLEVRITEEVITPDTEDFTTKKLINITYWLSRSHDPL